eukprot:Transcript_8946.p1 GENE.Transcript_8946~~Transcript_8946.p1  ORF type:complete len:126 (-),score=6.84 Transcript_8946:412-789(-)
MLRDQVVLRLGEGGVVVLRGQVVVPPAPIDVACRADHGRPDLWRRRGAELRHALPERDAIRRQALSERVAVRGRELRVGLRRPLGLPLPRWHGLVRRVKAAAAEGRRRRLLLGDHVHLEACGLML